MTQIIEGKRYETKTLSIGSTIQGGWLKTIHADMIENVSPDINKMPVTDREEIAEVLSTIEDSEWFVIAGDGRQVKIFTMSQVPQGEIVLKAGLKSWYDEQLACVMVAVLASDSF